MWHWAVVVFGLRMFRRKMIGVRVKSLINVFMLFVFELNIMFFFCYLKNILTELVGFCSESSMPLQNHDGLGKGILDNLFHFGFTNFQNDNDGRRR